jgi:hypothetical protein
MMDWGLHAAKFGLMRMTNARWLALEFVYRVATRRYRYCVGVISLASKSA